MAKVKVTIEEHLTKEVEIEVPDSIVEGNDSEAVIQKAREMYNNGEIVLTTDDFSGIKLIAITDEDFGETNWEEF
jgi:hypothetical protein